MAESGVKGDFPWHLGVFDAHCHPTDTLSSLHAIPSMRAKVLTVMSTRAQDQGLVASAAEKYGVSLTDAKSVDPKNWSKDHKIIPAFGWHPWFSHQMFDETEYDGALSLSEDQQVAHYQSILVPKSVQRDFLLALPPPRPFGHFLAETKEHLTRFPLALIGEVGLDRSFRIPEAWLPGQVEQRDNALTPGSREGRQLSPYKVSMEHQRKVLSAQLRLAGEMERAVSVHGVAAHGLVYETIAATWKGHEKHVRSKREKNRAETASRLYAEPSEAGNAEPRGTKPFPPRICMHSYSGPAETVKQYVAPSVPCEVFFSFSTTINAWSDRNDDHPGQDGKVEAAVKAVPDDRVLVESDLHTAGDRMDHFLEEIVRKICSVKGWDLHYGVRRLRSNWHRFVFGSDPTFDQQA